MNLVSNEPKRNQNKQTNRETVQVAPTETMFVYSYPLLVVAVAGS